MEPYSENIINVENMKRERSQFLKMLEYYRKFKNIRKSVKNISSLKSLNCARIFLYALYILHCVYLVLNPIRLIIALILLNISKSDDIFAYICIIFYQGSFYLLSFIKLFTNSKDNQLIETLAGIEIQDEDRKFYNCKVKFSYVSLSIGVLMTVAVYIVLDQLLPLLNTDLLAFFTYPVPINSTFTIPFLTIHVLINCTSLTFHFFDTYINFIIATILKYEFNKLAIQAQRYLKEQKPHVSILSKKLREITNICNAHDNLTTILRLVNESLRLTTGYIGIGSLISACIATYGIINDSFENNASIYIYITLAASNNLLFWFITLWNGICLHAAVSYAKY